MNEVGLKLCRLGEVPYSPAVLLTCMDEVDEDAKNMIESMENVLKEPSVKELDRRVRSLKYKIAETEGLLKRNAHLFDQNTQKAMRVAIERDRRSLITAEEDWKKKFEWHVKKALDGALAKITEQHFEKGMLKSEQRIP